MIVGISWFKHTYIYAKVCIDCMTSHITKMTIDDVRVMTTWCIISGMLRMSKLSNMLRYTWRRRSMKRVWSMKFKIKCERYVSTWSQIIMLMKMTAKMALLLNCQQDVYIEPFISVCKQRVNNLFDVDCAWCGKVFNTQFDHTI